MQNEHEDAHGDAFSVQSVRPTRNQERPHSFHYILCHHATVSNLDEVRKTHVGRWLDLRKRAYYCADAFIDEHRRLIVDLHDRQALREQQSRLQEQMQ